MASQGLVRALLHLDWAMVSQGLAKDQLHDLGCLGLGWATESQGLAMVQLRLDFLGLGWAMES